MLIQTVRFIVGITSILDEALFFETAVGHTTSYFVKIIWCSRLFCNPSSSFEDVYCYFAVCGLRMMVVAGYRRMCPCSFKGTCTFLESNKYMANWVCHMCLFDKKWDLGLSKHSHVFFYHENRGSFLHYVTATLIKSPFYGSYCTTLVAYHINSPISYVVGHDNQSHSKRMRKRRRCSFMDPVRWFMLLLISSKYKSWDMAAVNHKLN